jgi:antitoxin component YwqK of YwqJK toxin-antitoxin module
MKFPTRFGILSVLLFVTTFLHAQMGKQKNQSKFYTLEAIYDSSTGIDIYEKLNFFMGGDSVRYNQKGYVAQGTWEDYYANGAVLHTGYYIEGQLRSYKNFYPDGKTEREFKQLDYFHYQMTLYYSDGKVRSDITYYNGQEESTHEYYPNGNPEIAEEYAKKCEYLMFRTFYYENGKTQSDLQLADKKKKKYYLKEYFENGNLQTEGTMQYYPELDNYLKEGVWKVYDENGKHISTEEYVRGQMTEEKKVN